ncbi:MAG: hypothetical protein KKC46_03060 [Proteobacteria bacterium]|nr:hypothetical protein [Pseudomonadota bacterium]
MKIIDKEVIRNGEQDLIDSINGDLDWGTVEEIFKQQHRMDIGDDIEYKHGDIVVYNDQVAYRLEFDVKVNFTVLLDREGSCLLVNTPGCDESSCKDTIQNNLPCDESASEDNLKNIDNDEEVISESYDQSDIHDTDNMQERIAQAVSDVSGAITEN